MLQFLRLRCSPSTSSTPIERSMSANNKRSSVFVDILRSISSFRIWSCGFLRSPRNGFTRCATGFISCSPKTIEQGTLSEEFFFFSMFIERSSIVPTIIWHGMQIYINVCAIGCESHTFWCILYKLHSYNLSSYDSGTGMLASWRL